MSEQPAVAGASASAAPMVALPRIAKYKSYNEWRDACGMTHLLQLHVNMEVQGGNLFPVGKILLGNGDKR